MKKIVVLVLLVCLIGSVAACAIADMVVVDPIKITTKTVTYKGQPATLITYTLRIAEQRPYSDSYKMNTVIQFSEVENSKNRVVYGTPDKVLSTPDTMFKNSKPTTKPTVKLK